MLKTNQHNTTTIRIISVRMNNSSSQTQTEAQQCRVIMVLISVVGMQKWQCQEIVLITTGNLGSVVVRTVVGLHVWPSMAQSHLYKGHIDWQITMNILQDRVLLVTGRRRIIRHVCKWHKFIVFCTCVTRVTRNHITYPFLYMNQHSIEYHHLD